MNTIAERYDRDAREYERYWAPVIDAAARRLLERCDAFVRAATRITGDAVRIVDVGTGTGVLSGAASDRWPNVIVMATDASEGMLAVARERADREAAAGARRDGITWVRADADRLPAADGSVDLVISSFVYQLVPDRGAALREAFRVLRPGGHIALVTWLAGRGATLEAADVFDDAVVDLGIEEEEAADEVEELRAGDFRSARAAAAELRSAGFRRVSASRDHLAYDWTPATYLTYKEHYDERALFASLDEPTRARLLEVVHGRFAELPASAFGWRPPIVYVVGQRPPSA
jgi:ubiquinone/menaquinone biosynthesis C-methylase UbiE